MRKIFSGTFNKTREAFIVHGTNKLVTKVSEFKLLANQLFF